LNRFYQTLFVVAYLPLCWLAMQAVHELGHVVAAKASGSVIVKVVLHPLEISRTEVTHNARPLLVAWAGPIVGAFAPLLLWLAWRALRWPELALVQFFAGFCLIANGAYLGVGAIHPVGDALEIARYGGAAWELALFGLATIPPAFWLWHGLGPAFGFGPASRTIPPHFAIGVGLLLLSVVLIELVL
jgi:hypothetical protein